MDADLLSGLIVNAAILLAASMIIVIFNHYQNIFSLQSKKYAIITGIITGAAGILLMMNSIEVSAGVVFDTRTILVGTTGLFFGWVPALVSFVIIVAYRMLLGGDGMMMGIMTTLLAGCLGLIWRHFRINGILNRSRKNWLEFYLFGLAVHIGMIACVVFLPRDMAGFVFRTISLPVILLYPAVTMLLCLVVFAGIQSDRTRQQLQESERSRTVLIQNLPGMVYRCAYDRDWTMHYVSEGSYDLTGYRPESLLFNKELAYNDLIAPEFRELLWARWKEALDKKEKFREEYEIITGQGEHKWVLEQGQGIYNEQGEVEALEGIVIDFTDRKMRENEIKYISYHDFLTGLFNRRYFDQEVKRLDKAKYLPLSVIVGDINGLKLINDAFGHTRGDRMIQDAAKLIQACCRSRDVLARTGGDEFSVLLPNTDRDVAYQILNCILKQCENNKNKCEEEIFNLNLSLGFETKESQEEDFNQIIRQAESYMYKRKLLEHTSAHSTIFSYINATLYEKSKETEEHAIRLKDLSRMIGLELHLSETAMDELTLLAMLHDIGKIGIDDRILNKPGPLNKKEWAVMKTHPEIGYRIAMSSPDLVPIAQLILCHHEKWDGSGYPQGLKGEDIPLPSRILAVVDAYDAMTKDRVYRKAVSKEEALAEIERGMGTQFDPEISQIFLSLIRQNPDL